MEVGGLASARGSPRRRKKGPPSELELRDALTRLAAVRIAAAAAAPKPYVLVSLLEQQEQRNIAVVTDVLLTTLRRLVRHPRWYLTRFRAALRAKRVIHHAWALARLRTAARVMHVVARWVLLEKDQARVQQARSGFVPQLPGRPGRAVSLPNAYGSMRLAHPEDEAPPLPTVPLSLKKRTVLFCLLRMRGLYSTKVRPWARVQRQYLSKLSAAERVPPNKRAEFLATAVYPGAEPSAPFFETLTRLTHAELVDLSLRPMDPRDETAAAAVPPVTETLYANPVDAYCAGYTLRVARWPGLMAQVAEFGRSAEGMGLEGPVERRVNRFAGIPSRLFSALPADVGRRTRPVSQTPGGTSSHDRAVPTSLTLAELQALPVVSKMKSSPWNPTPTAPTPADKRLQRRLTRTHVPARNYKPPPPRRPSNRRGTSPSVALEDSGALAVSFHASVARPRGESLSGTNRRASLASSAAAEALREQGGSQTVPVGAFVPACDPPTFAQLDRHSQSLVLRGVRQAPAPPHFLDHDDGARRRQLMEQVADEIPLLPCSRFTATDLLRTRRAMQIQLGVTQSTRRRRSSGL